MAQTILNHLDHPLRILGVKVTTLAIFPAALVSGAVFESFFGVLGAVTLLLIAKSYLEKLPKFTLMRLLYKNLPTDKVFGKTAPHLLPSHIEKWVK